MAFIDLQGVRKIYRDGDNAIRPVDGVDLTFDQGDFTAIMGPSGSGKSTLLLLLGGLIAPEEGIVRVDGIDIYSLSDNRLARFRNEYIGFVFQQFFLVPHLTALENVMLPLSTNGTSAKEIRRVAHEMLEQVGLGKFSGRLPSRLSGGEQQRVAIARALVKKPLIILADEPTGNLDCASGGSVLDTLRDLNVAGHTVIMVTHNKEDASRADSIVYMRDGRVEALSVCKQKEDLS